MAKTITIMNRLLMILILSLVAGCSEEEADGGSSSPSFGSSPVDNTPINTVEATGFWINAQSTQHSILVNQDGNFGTDCFIDADTTSNILLNCNIDVLEGDLYMYDITIQYNAPPALCDHVRVTPAWHWNYSSGYGPSTITVDINSSSDPAIVTACTATDALSVVGACSAHPELFDVSNPVGPTCIYDKTDSGGKNCCFGDYTLTINDDTDGDAATDVVTVTQTQWGEDFTSCTGGGLIKNGWEHFTKSGLPANLIHKVPKDANDQTVGLNEAIELVANATTTQSSFSTMANHYEKSGSPHNHDGYISATTSNLPFAVDPVDDLDGSNMIAGSDAYVFTCLDSAFEIKHQIRAYIREWNTLADFVAFETSSGATYNPDVSGVEGTNCAYDGVFGDGCNDFTDFTDILNAVGGSYPTTPGAGAAAARESYHPRVDYD